MYKLCTKLIGEGAQLSKKKLLNIKKEAEYTPIFNVQFCMYFGHEKVFDVKTKN